MSKIKKLFGQTAIYGLGTIVPRFLNYLLTPLYTYLFTNPSDYGINAEIYAYISFLNIIFTYGMETAFFHFSNKYDSNKVFNNALSLLIISTTFLSFILIIFSNQITQILHYNNTLFIYWTIGILASDAILAIPFAYLRQQQKALRFSILKLSNVLINILFNLFFFLICKRYYDENNSHFLARLYNPEIGIGYGFLSNLLANISTILMMYPVWKKFHFYIDKNLSKEMFRYALPLVVVGLAGMVNETFDRIILKFLLPENIAQSAQGIYGACYKLSILITIFIQAYRYAAEPFFFNTFKEADAKQTYSKATEAFIAFGLFLWLATNLNLPILKYFIGPSYRVGLSIVPVLLTANLFLGIYFNLSFWYKLTGQTQIGAYLTIVGAIITLIINFVFVPKYSYVASAYATLAAYGTMMILSYFLGQRYYPVSYPLKKITLYFVISLILYFIANKISFTSNLHQIIFNNFLLLLFILFLYYNYSSILKFKNISHS
jgi:O-antigen/teichoic acid export membrane protein